MQFIGELGKLEILAENILHQCIQQLLPRKSHIQDMAEDVECLCQIMRTCGRILDHEQGQVGVSFRLFISLHLKLFDVLFYPLTVRKKRKKKVRKFVPLLTIRFMFCEIIATLVPLSLLHSLMQYKIPIGARKKFEIFSSFLRKLINRVRKH